MMLVTLLLILFTDMINTNGGSLVCVAGLSGHGFKMVPVLGKAVADLAIDGVTSLPIKFLGLDRFKKE